MVAVDSRSFPHSYALESFGVRLAVHTTVPEAIPKIEEVAKLAVPVPFDQIDPADATHHIRYQWSENGRDSLFDGMMGPLEEFERSALLSALETKIRFTVAEHAENYLFVHAGVVGWKGKAIMIPGQSYSGKTTLTAELVRRGATYYSDDLAIVDANGLVWPFPKRISLRREGEYAQKEHHVGDIGGEAGTEPIPIGLVVITRYERGAVWEPSELTPGEASLEVLKNTVQIRGNPAFSLNVLSKVVAGATTIRSPRGNAADIAPYLLSTLTRKNGR